MPSSPRIDLWGVVKVVVESRGRTLERYRYFEELWSQLEEKRLIFLQAPTGAGKTEAVLAPFLRDLIEGVRKWHSLVYVLPTRSLVYNMFYRFCSALRACKESFGKPKYVVIDYDYGGFTPAKAFIEGDITVTTYDTLLYTFYGFRSYGHHLLLSVGKIAGSLVILDEVQLLQDSHWYSLSLMPYHITNLVALGATVVVMTATLPKVLKENTLEVLSRSLLEEFSHSVVKAHYEENPIKRGKLDVEIKRGRLLDSVSGVIKNLDKPILLVFNTVERAVEAFRQVKKSGLSAVLLHSRIVSRERRLRESLFERGGEEFPEVVVATQVAEAGVDFDFRTIATEISPIDSLIQRLGRCARRRDGEALIFDDVEQAKGVYPDVAMNQTVQSIDEASLSASTVNVEVAADLVNGVYSKDVVNQLSEQVSDELNKSLAFIKPFRTSFVYVNRELLRNFAHALLRLGTEIRCVLPSAELYEQILSSKDSLKISGDMIAKLLSENILSISIMQEKVGAPDVPALKHQIGGKEVYLAIHVVYDASSQSFEGIKIKSFSSMRMVIDSLRRQSLPLLVINPSYYERYGDYDLGLVKLYD